MYSNQRINEVVDAYGLFTYRDPLIFLAVENFDDWKDRELCVRKSGFLNTYICKLDEEIFAEDPITVPNVFEIEEIKNDWNRENWSDLLIRIFDKTRAHRYCVVKLYDAPPYWRVFYERQITKFIPDEDGNLEACDVEWSYSIPKSDKHVKFTETIKFYNPLNDNNDETGLLITYGEKDDTDGQLHLGKNDIETLWTLDVYIRYCLLDIAANSAKTSGFFWLMYGSRADEDTRKAILNSMDLAGSMRGIGADEEILKKITAMYPAKPEFTVQALSEFVKAFAHAARLPLAYFRSEREQGGMFDVQSIDEVKINKKKRFVFKQLSNSMITLIFMRWGILVQEIYPNIEEMEGENYKDEIEVKIPDEADKEDVETNKEDVETDKKVNKENEE